jgi:hypothetical protein
VAANDSRLPNVVHSATDALKSSFALFTLKASSLFSFQPKTEIQLSNLKSVYRIAQLPSDNGIRNTLNQLSEGISISSAQSIFVRRGRAVALRHPASGSLNINMLAVPARSYS